jgi:prepilin-type N-terminal cleavage/methylation domain-containing protein
MKTDDRGFSMPELLITLSVLGILATIAIPRYQAVRERALVSTMASDLRNLASHQEVFYNERFTFSTTLAELDTSSSPGVTLTIDEATAKGWSATASHAALGSSAQCVIRYGDLETLVSVDNGGAQPSGQGQGRGRGRGQGRGQGQAGPSAPPVSAEPVSTTNAIECSA